ncbi:MAG: hypothetical protein ACI9MF_002724, partial [Gammaproteobacteria bacterium]
KSQTGEYVQVTATGHGKHSTYPYQIQMTICMLRNGVTVIGVQVFHACKAGIFPVTVGEYDSEIQLLQGFADSPRNISCADNQ